MLSLFYAECVKRSFDNVCLKALFTILFAVKYVLILFMVAGEIQPAHYIDHFVAKHYLHLKMPPPICLASSNVAKFQDQRLIKHPDEIVQSASPTCLSRDAYVRRSLVPI